MIEAESNVLRTSCPSDSEMKELRERGIDVVTYYIEGGVGTLDEPFYHECTHCGHTIFRGEHYSNPTGCEMDFRECNGLRRKGN